MTLEELRRQIDALDKNLLQKIADRLELCKKTNAEKNGQIDDLEREEEIRKLWQEEAKRLELSDSFTEAVLDLILAESKYQQEENT